MAFGQSSALQLTRRILAWGEEHPVSVTTLALLIGALIGQQAHSAFGVSQDEPAVLKFGLDTWLYVLGLGSAPRVPDWHFYNPVVQEVLAVIIYTFHVADIHDVWLLSHYLMFVVFLCGVAAFIALARKMTGSIWWAILGSIWFVCTPRVFAHAFVNPKDIPAMTFFTLSMFTMVRMLDRPTVPRILLHCVVCAISISVRTFGLLVPMLTVAYLLGRAAPYSISTLRRALVHSAIYLTCTAIITVAVWPALWNDPVRMFIGAVADNTSRTAGGLYMGRAITEVPWHYVPVWMGITIPPLYSAAFLVGIIRAACWIGQSTVTTLRQQPLIILTIAWLTIPIAAQIVLNIGIFNEWRHLLFIYPAFLLIALAGSAWLFGRASDLSRWGLAALLVAGTVSPAVWMWRNSGLQQMYFSVPSSLVAGNFELDYWNLSYRQGIEWILANDARTRVVLYGMSRTMFDSAATLDDTQRSRIEITREPRAADYILVNYSSNEHQAVVSDESLVHTLNVDGLRVLGIYKMR